MALSSYARNRVWERDHGICEGCHADTDFLRRIRWILKRRDESDGFHALKRVWGIFDGLGTWKLWDLPNLWEADHRIPLAEGGTNALENYRTLCIDCHRAATRELRSRLAARRRARPNVSPR